MAATPQVLKGLVYCVAVPQGDGNWFLRYILKHHQIVKIAYNSLQHQCIYVSFRYIECGLHRGATKALLVPQFAAILGVSEDKLIPFEVYTPQDFALYREQNKLMNTTKGVYICPTIEILFSIQWGESY